MTRRRPRYLVELARGLALLSVFTHFLLPFAFAVSAAPGSIAGQPANFLCLSSFPGARIAAEVLPGTEKAAALGATCDHCALCTVAESNGARLVVPTAWYEAAQFRAVEPTDRPSETLAYLEPARGPPIIGS